MTEVTIPRKFCWRRAGPWLSVRDRIADPVSGCQSPGLPDHSLQNRDEFSKFRSHHPSFFPSNSFTICGLACPLDAFITCPTKKPSMVFFPARYCSSCLGLAARI